MRLKCAVVGHSKLHCTTETFKCYKCDGDHSTGHRKCAEQRFQPAIVEIQTDKKVDRRTATAAAKERFPQRMTYA